MPQQRETVAVMRSLIWIFSVLLFCSANVGSAQSSEQIKTAGLDGHYRVGCWTGVQLTQHSKTTVQTRDGDGVRVKFSNRINEAGLSDWVYIIPGSEAAPLSVIRDGETIQTDRLPPTGPPSRGPAMLPIDMPWTVVFGDPLGLDKIGKNDLLRRAATVAVTVPESADGLPDAAIGYDAVDVMLVTGSGADVLSNFDELQAQAVVDWVTSGGRIVMTLGQSTPKLLAAAPWLTDLLPFDASQIVSINPSAIETYTSTQTQLDSFKGVKLPRDHGQVLIMGRTTRRTIAPITSQFNVGLGTVVVVSADLESDPFQDWPQRFEFVTAMAGDAVLPTDAADKVQSQRTAYNDLAGQLRMTLDQFEIRRGVGFSVISLILMGLIAAIGPLDYFLINRLLGRPLLGWMTFPIIAIAVSALLVWQSQPVASASAGTSATREASVSTKQLVQCNRVEFIDIDGASAPGIGRGKSINFLYSHDAGMFDVQGMASESLQAMSNEVKSCAASFGHPGESFGGIQIALEDARLPSYTAASTLESDFDQPLLSSLPIAPRSSKGFFHQFEFRTDVASGVQLTRKRGSELLQGELVNPLPVDLLDGMLIYRNWVYLLPTRFKSGASVASLKNLRQKNFRWFLSRQQAIESSSQTEAWDPTQTDDLARLAEVLMFHHAVGGTTYTGLKHEPLSHIDLSQSLVADRCVLLGRTESVLTDLQITSVTDDSDQFGEPRTPVGKSLSLLRLVLPVEATRR